MGEFLDFWSNEAWSSAPPVDVVGGGLVDGKAKVDDFDLFQFEVDEDIGGLYVAMDDSQTVHVGNGLYDVVDDSFQNRKVFIGENVV